jgi:hypothetical protein
MYQGRTVFSQILDFLPIGDGGDGDVGEILTFE